MKEVGPFEVELDEYREGMLDELEEEFGEDFVNETIEQNLSGTVEESVRNIIVMLYDNKDEVRE